MDGTKRTPSVVRRYFGEIQFPPPYDKDLQYQATDTEYRISSVGRDGEVGGLEACGDLDQYPNGHVCSDPTLEEFLYESPYRDTLFLAAAVSSIAAGAGCYYRTRRLTTHRRPLMAPTLSVALMSVAGSPPRSVLAYMIAELH